MVRLSISTVPREVFYHRGDPDLCPSTIHYTSCKSGITYSGKSHALDIIQHVNHALPASPAINLISCYACRSRRAIRTCKPIRKELINRLTAPFRRSERSHCACGSKTHQCSRELHDRSLFDRNKTARFLNSCNGNTHHPGSYSYHMPCPQPKLI